MVVLDALLNRPDAVGVILGASWATPDVIRSLKALEDCLKIFAEACVLAFLHVVLVETAGAVGRSGGRAAPAGDGDRP